MIRRAVLLVKPLRDLRRQSRMGPPVRLFYHTVFLQDQLQTKNVIVFPMIVRSEFLISDSNAVLVIEENHENLYARGVAMNFGW